MLSDYLKDLVNHKARVAEYMQRAAADLFTRAAVHDNSKYSPEEFEAYEKAFPEFQKYAFGSEELQTVYKSIRPALQHHFRENRHHPEHFENGVNDMNLLDLLEMVCDWLAASERSQTGIVARLLINKERYNIDDQLFAIIESTAELIAPHRFETEQS